MSPHKLPRVILIASLIVSFLALSQGTAKAQDRFPYGCWVQPAHSYYDNDYKDTYQVPEGKFFFKADNELVWEQGGLGGRYRVQVSGGEARTTETFHGEEWRRLDALDDYHVFRLTGDGQIVVVRYYYDNKKEQHFLDDRHSSRPLRRAKNSTCGMPDEPSAPSEASQAGTSPKSKAQASRAGGSMGSNNSTSQSITTPSTDSNGSDSDENKDQIDRDDEAGVTNTSDWVSDVVGDYKSINIRNNSRKRTIRITKLLIYDCVNLNTWDCGLLDVNQDLPPGSSSSIRGGIGPNDIMSGVKPFSFKYKYWAVFNDPKPFPTPRRKP